MYELHVKSLEEYFNLNHDIRDIQALLEKGECWFQGKYRYTLTKDRSFFEEELSRSINAAVDELENILNSLTDDFILVLNYGVSDNYVTTGKRIQVHRSHCESFKLRNGDTLEHFTNFSEAFDKGYGLTNVIMTDIHTCDHCRVSWDNGRLKKEVDEWRVNSRKS